MIKLCEEAEDELKKQMRIIAFKPSWEDATRKDACDRAAKDEPQMCRAVQYSDACWKNRGRGKNGKRNNDE